YLSTVRIDLRHPDDARRHGRHRLWRDRYVPHGQGDSSDVCGDMESVALLTSRDGGRARSMGTFESGVNARCSRVHSRTDRTNPRSRLPGLPPTSRPLTILGERAATGDYFWASRPFCPPARER